jgi:hypothetical protein
MLVPGEPDAAVSGAAKRSGADVLVIGRTPDRFSWRIRSNAYGIIRRAPCAVVSVDSVASHGLAEARLDAVSRPEQREEEEAAV